VEKFMELVLDRISESAYQRITAIKRLEIDMTRHQKRSHAAKRARIALFAMWIARGRS
jgi:hypothetical protein